MPIKAILTRIAVRGTVYRLRQSAQRSLAAAIAANDGDAERWAVILERLEFWHQAWCGAAGETA